MTKTKRGPGRIVCKPEVMKRAIGFTGITSAPPVISRLDPLPLLVRAHLSLANYRIRRCFGISRMAAISERESLDRCVFEA
jgi:hypothetical protein